MHNSRIYFGFKLNLAWEFQEMNCYILNEIEKITLEIKIVNRILNSSLGLNANTLPQILLYDNLFLKSFFTPFFSRKTYIPIGDSIGLEASVK